MRIFITGDKHGNFELVEDFVKTYKTTLEDYLIVLGDGGVNYLGYEDYFLKEKLSNLPITFVFIHGNHEIRPQNIPSYELKIFSNDNIAGGFYQEPRYPNLLFARRGPFWIRDKRFLVCDGAYSIDKDYRTLMGWPWWVDEQMNGDDKDFIRSTISMSPQFDFILSHAAPLSHEPRHLFLTGFDFPVDNSTPIFLDEVYDSIDKEYLTQWFFGHYHGDEKLPDKFTILYNTFEQVV